MGHSFYGDVAAATKKVKSAQSQTGNALGDTDLHPNDTLGHKVGAAIVGYFTPGGGGHHTAAVKNPGPSTFHGLGTAKFLTPAQRRVVNHPAPARRGAKTPFKANPSAGGSRGTVRPSAPSRGGAGGSGSVGGSGSAGGALTSPAGAAGGAGAAPAASSNPLDDPYSAQSIDAAVTAYVNANTLPYQQQLGALKAAAPAIGTASDQSAAAEQTQLANIASSSSAATNNLAGLLQHAPAATPGQTPNTQAFQQQLLGSGYGGNLPGMIAGESAGTGAAAAGGSQSAVQHLADMGTADQAYMSQLQAGAVKSDAWAKQQAQLQNQQSQVGVQNQISQATAQGATQRYQMQTAAAQAKLQQQVAEQEFGLKAATLANSQESTQIAQQNANTSATRVNNESAYQRATLTLAQQRQVSSLQKIGSSQSSSTAKAWSSFLKGTRTGTDSVTDGNGNTVTKDVTKKPSVQGYTNRGEPTWMGLDDMANDFLSQNPTLGSRQAGAAVIAAYPQLLTQAAAAGYTLKPTSHGWVLQKTKGK